MVLFVLRKLILQTRMRSHPVGLDVWFLAGRLCDKYHNLMSWLKSQYSLQFTALNYQSMMRVRSFQLFNVVS